MNKQELGKRCRIARWNANLRQEDIAAAINVNRSAVSEIERGVRSVSAIELWEIARITKTSMMSFFQGYVPKIKKEIPMQPDQNSECEHADKCSPGSAMACRFAMLELNAPCACSCHDSLAQQVKQYLVIRGTVSIVDVMAEFDLTDDEARELLQRVASPVRRYGSNDESL